MAAAFAATRSEADRQYFFSQLRNPLWVQPLLDRGYFQAPPVANHLPDGSIQFPSWPELEYLKNIVADAPTKVITVVNQLPPVDNCRVYEYILDITLALSGKYSAKLTPKVLEYAKMQPYLMPHKWQQLLVHWVNQDQTAVALELAEMLVQFLPDPKSEDKKRLRRRNPTDLASWLQPEPRLDPFEYVDLLQHGVRRLAERLPAQVARILALATSRMIDCSIHSDELDRRAEEDWSEAWCPRLTEQGDSLQPRQALVSALTFACEKAYESGVVARQSTDELLRSQRSHVFRRVRYHVYAKYPAATTRSPIREAIATHREYSQWEHHYEFQRMVRCACEHFGDDLLTKEELTTVFQAIAYGPSKEVYRELLADQYSDEGFRDRQREFHRRQFRPFAGVLFGEYATYFQELQEGANHSISDDDYFPFGHAEATAVAHQSPRSATELASLDDDALLEYINGWDAPHFDIDRYFIVSIEALAEEFRIAFLENIVPDTTRRQFWMENQGRIGRPIYVRVMVDVMQQRIEAQDFGNLGNWLAFCDWTVSYRNEGRREVDGGTRAGEGWASVRRAVGDFLGSCLRQNELVAGESIVAMKRILRLLCTQYDPELDQGTLAGDELSVGINSARGKAVDELIAFGARLKRIDKDADTSFVREVLDERLSHRSERPVTAAELAILGMRYGEILWLDERWGTQRTPDLFPRRALAGWIAGFSSFLRFGHPWRRGWDALRGHYEFALEHVAELDGSGDSGGDGAEALGRHIVVYYLWGLFPLTGPASLLERYYGCTGDDRRRWTNAFEYVGRSLRNAGDDVDPQIVTRAVEFFEWRIEVGDPVELGGFALWLDAACLDGDWRLTSYSRVMDTDVSVDRLSTLQAEFLHRLLPRNVEKTLECFRKLTERLENGGAYIRTHTARQILKAGLQSSVGGARRDAERARDNLLRAGRFELLHLDSEALSDG